MKEKTFIKGQEVFCSYYCEYSMEFKKMAYKRSFFERLIDKPFKGPKTGFVVGSAGYHDYWLCGKKQLYVLVKFKEYFFAKPIPISCIQDRAEHAKQTLKFLTDNEHRIGQPGYSLEDYFKLKNNI